MVVKACDVGSVDMMVADAENPLEYRHAADGWQRLPAAPLNAPPSSGRTFPRSRSTWR
jgi:hypothetical protein